MSIGTVSQWAVVIPRHLARTLLAAGSHPTPATAYSPRRKRLTVHPGQHFRGDASALSILRFLGHAGVAYRTVGWIAVLALYGSTRAADASRGQYIADDLADRIVIARQDWGSLGLNTAVKPPSNAGPMKLRIKDREYARGLGQHANGEIVIALEGEFTTFEAEIGIQWQGGRTVGSVVFQVFADGTKRFDSGIVKENDPPRKVSIPIRGADRLKLVATTVPIGDGITCDAANWANARLIRDPHPKAAPQREYADMAPFAEVATWDPLRVMGTSASRTEEFPAEDVRLARLVVPSRDGTYQVPGPALSQFDWLHRPPVARNPPGTRSRAALC